MFVLLVNPVEAADADWGTVDVPAPMDARAIGGHARGCLGGALALPQDGAGYQVMRPSRNRFFGHPTLIAFVQDFAAEMQAHGWSGLLIGDLAQPRGGPMSSGHRSHQTGLDVDIWFLPGPASVLSPAQREELSAISMVDDRGLGVDRGNWTEGHALLLQVAASFPQVDRIFVNAAIKQELCRTIRGDRAWLAKLRPWWGHDHHFHVGLRCPAGADGCFDRKPPVPPGDGCDATLEWWFSEEAKLQLQQSRAAPPQRLTLDDLPPACRTVLAGG